MTKITVRLHEPSFSAIEDGVKKFEVRLCDEKRQRLAVGDVVEFQSRENRVTIEKTIIGLHQFTAFADFYATHPEELEIVDVRDFYSKEDEQKYGVLAIELG